MTATVTAADTRFYRAQQTVVRQTAETVEALWPNLDLADLRGSWPQVRDEAVSAVFHGQVGAAGLAQSYVAGTMAAVGSVSKPLGRLVATAFAGLTSGGLPLVMLLDYALDYLRRALAAGVPPSEASAMGLRRMLTYVSSEINDAGRTATHVASILEPATVGYGRIVHLPACGRCILLAGRYYRHSQGFRRHRRCDCQMKPVTRSDWDRQRAGNHPRALFESMSAAQQDKAFGKGDAAALRAGADMSRVVNARRKGQLYRAGGRQYTREATTTRGIGRHLGQLHTRRGDRYRSSSVARPTAAQLVDSIPDRDELVQQLRRFGYLR